jgi:hypothetical protein
MHASSRIVTSKQPGIHEQLSALLTRQTDSPFKKPLAEVNRLSFEHSMAVWPAAVERTSRSSRTQLANTFVIP